MLEKTYITSLGTIHYWIHMIDTDIVTLVFLPGLTADHRLFENKLNTSRVNTMFLFGMRLLTRPLGHLGLTLTFLIKQNG